MFQKNQNRFQLDSIALSTV